MKLLIACDMEGISGIVNWEQVTPGHAEYMTRGRRLMTDDVNAAINGAFSGGATEVLVSDGHWDAGNILIEELDSRARLNSGSPSPFSMVEGLEDKPKPDAVVFVGYHALAGTKKAILDHTWSSARVRALYLNERLVGEIGLNAAVAAHYGVPVLALTGDQHACAEAQDFLGAQLEVAVVKNATGRFAAQCLPLAEARHKICEAVSRGVLNWQAGQAPAPFVIEPPVRVAVEFFNTQHADRAFLMPGTERLSGTRVEYAAPDMIVAVRAFRAMVTLARD